jgi:hypothetical protein
LVQSSRHHLHHAYGMQQCISENARRAVLHVGCIWKLWPYTALVQRARCFIMKCAPRHKQCSFVCLCCGIRLRSSV